MSLTLIMSRSFWLSKCPSDPAMNTLDVLAEAAAKLASERRSEWSVKPRSAKTARPSSPLRTQSARREALMRPPLAG